ncbi:MAG: S41 family peptidase [Flavobacteriales bacterium]|nr:S41 family peptidase [Flavobacteriales bacterium]
MSDLIDDYLKKEPETPRSSDKKPSLLQPLLYALLLIIGVFVGFSMGGGGKTTSFGGVQSGNPNKLVSIINKIDQMYVDSVKKKELIDEAIKSILQNLDPHSYYISAEEMAASTEPLQGNFEGIGVEFLIQKDTLLVVHPIEGGPSEELGIRAGDRILEVDGENIAGIGLTNDKVMKLLKGKKGSKVNLKVKRRGAADNLDFEIIRDKIPIFSVVADMNVTDEIGYVKITRFAKNTDEEFIEAVDQLRADGAKKLIIDLRGNGGGYLHTCIPIIEEFLEKGKLIVYTEGLNEPRADYKSRKNGKYRDMDVVVLVNQGSASASEILAGALQDQDRSITVGRRSFGKGLVQNQVPLPDNSALRLTVARYYTPTGRSIQKPYGEGIDYDNDYYDRYDHGELLSADSISFADSLKFTTPGGRVVYGGGGIMPEFFVPLDTMTGSIYLNELLYNGMFRTYGYEYAEDHQAMKDRYNSVDDFIKASPLSSADMEAFYDAATKEGITKDLFGIERSAYAIKIRLMAEIARNWYGQDGYYRVLLEDDVIFEKAMNVMKNYQSYAVVDGKLNLLEGAMLN